MIAFTEEKKQEIHESFLKQGLMQTFQAQLEHLEHGHTIISMPYSAAVSQQHAFFHGGVIGSLCDSACGYAAISILQDGEAALTAEYKINFLAPASGEKIEAHGRILKAGRTLIVCQGDVFIIQQGQKKRCAAMLMTMCVVKHLANK